MHQLFYGKSLKITIKLHCLILPQMGNLMTPVQFWGCLSFSKKLPARASILKKKNNNNNHYIQGSSLVCSTTEAQGFRFNSRGKALRPCCRIACITLRGRDVALVFLWPVFVGEKGKGLVLSCGYTFRYTTYVLVHELLFIICLGCLFFGICLGGTWKVICQSFTSHWFVAAYSKRWPCQRWRKLSSIHQVLSLEKTMKNPTWLSMKSWLFN